MTTFIPLSEAQICPECDLIRRGPGPCACGNSETVSMSRALTHPADRPRVVSFRSAPVRIPRGSVVRRAFAPDTHHE